MYNDLRAYIRSLISTNSLQLQYAEINLPGYDKPVDSAVIMDSFEMYRYALFRIWDNALPHMIVIMLNPSTATHVVPDPTITRVMGLARRMGYGGITVMNLFAFRATDPKDMRRAVDPIGPANDEVILSICHHKNAGEDIVCAWGTNGTFNGRDKAVCEMLNAHGHRVKAFAITKEGHPGHPLYLPNDTKLLIF